MASVNKAIIIGFLGNDPATRFLPDGKAVCNFTVATSEQWKDKSGEKQEKTEWHRITAFGKLAEICGEYLKKGTLVYIEGKLSTRKWTDKEGVERYTTEIGADTMKILSGRDDNQRTASKPAPKPKQEAKSGAFNDMSDDVPF